MIFDCRRLITLSILAALVVGASIASQKSAASSADTVSPNPLPAKIVHPERAPKNFATVSNGQSPNPDDVKTARREFTVYRNEAGEIACREATSEEISARQEEDLTNLGLRRINHPELGKSSAGQVPESTNLMIVLRATQQLQQNSAAAAAFNRAAQNWENVIMSPITIYLDVDFGSTNFGQPWPSGVLGATGSPRGSYPYSSVRGNLIAEANGEGNATKQAIFNSLPATTLPTDLGDASAVDVSDSIARAIGLLPATAQATDNAARIAFNSSFPFDFDPSDGIAGIDFDAVATHEIGHALGFNSDAGLNVPKPTVWDLYRFRTGTTTSSFPTAQRILTIGGSPDPLQYDFIPGHVELGLSTGGPDGSTTNGADGWQSSHWQHVAGCGISIGIMDPAIPNGCRRTITKSDLLALASFGYSLTGSSSPPPPPPSPTPPANDNFANRQTISGCSGTVTGTTFGATSEAGEPNHDPNDVSSQSPGHTVWFRWSLPTGAPGQLTLNTQGSDFDTIVTVYIEPGPGSGGTGLGSLIRIASNDDSGPGTLTSSVTFNAGGGGFYAIVIDGWGGDSGDYQLNWSQTNCPSPTPTPTPTPVCPTQLTVNDPGDADEANRGDGICATAGGVCTLRAALAEAQSRSACGPVNIDLSGVTGTITLNNPLNISHDLDIIGPGPDKLTIQRNPAAGTLGFGIFTTSANVSISGVTLTNGLSIPGQGDGGGAIHNRGTLSLTNVSIVNNQASQGGGGGIWNDGGGALTILNSTISGNQTVAGFTTPGAGGGILSSGNSLTIVNSTISGNKTGDATSGFKPDGGGIDVGAGATTLINCTVTNNQSGLTGRGGGITADPTGTQVVNLQNTLVANNTGGPANSSPDLLGSFVSHDYNLIGNTSGMTFTGPTTHNVTNVNPLLGPLSLNGGPTMTHALLTGSPAINAGSNALAVDQSGVALTTDQRGSGFPRIINGTVDIGAFETTAAGPSPTPTPTPTPTLSPTPTPTPTASPTPTPTPGGKPPCNDDMWRATSTINAPVGRSRHTSVWTGSEMIVFGGQDANFNAMTGGGRYNPQTDTWVAISSVNAPSARAGHTAIWTGTEMIVFGGNSGATYFSDGAKYNPVTDTWTSISSVNAPTRSSHVAIWTGSEMIIWGGSNSTGILNTGARYNPQTNSWTAMTNTNAPIPRFTQAAVWTGSEMIIWGGNGNSFTNTGGRYNPNTDTWTATTIVNAPSARIGPTAVWTGTQMIVWGGSELGSVVVATGAKYDPGTDSWTPIANAPGARSGHVAVWTGKEMFVWGGSLISSTLSNIGERYNPASDSWIAACDTNAPAARANHTLIWTGSESIAWGGTPSPTGAPLNSGGKYSIPANPIDAPNFFVRRHYLDFLNREPDVGGWDFWANEILSCGSDQQCIEVKRINVSAAFFLSIEFQQTGNFVYKMYKAAFGNPAGKPVAVDRTPFLTDTRQIQSTPAQVIVGQGNWQAQLETNKQAFALAFVQRPSFQALPGTQTAADYVSMLFANAGVSPTSAETTAAINAFGAGGDAGRAAALRSVAESSSVTTKVNNEAFVLMQYFGYLQRNPYDPPEPTLNYDGYNFWLGKLNQFNGDFIAAEMVKAFISSTEYRQRFGP
jgi:N-acetylneuraminic acid mutarotase